MSNRAIFNARRAASAFALALGLFCLFPAAASAGPAAELDCVVAGLSAHDASALAASVGTGRATAKEDIRPAARAIVDCARRFDWTRDEMSAASHYLNAFAAQQRFRAALQGQGLDVAGIERQIGADTALVDAAAQMRSEPPPELSAFITRISPSLAGWQAEHGDTESLTAIAGLITSTAVVEGMRRRFTR